MQLTCASRLKLSHVFSIGIGIHDLGHATRAIGLYIGWAGLHWRCSTCIGMQACVIARYNSRFDSGYLTCAQSASGNFTDERGCDDISVSAENCWACLNGLMGIMRPRAKLGGRLVGNLQRCEVGAHYAHVGEGPLVDQGSVELEVWGRAGIGRRVSTGLVELHLHGDNVWQQYVQYARC